MHLFETIPGNFFSILSSKNKELYVDALMRLNDLFRYELNIETGAYVAELIALLENRHYEMEEDDEENGVPDEGGLTLSAKARLILHRLVTTGWIDREHMDGSYTEVITPRDYAIPVMKLLHDLSDTQLREYNSLVFSTYSGLRNAHENHPLEMYEAILAAKSNTERLVYELKTLYHGIRRYLRRIQGQGDVNALLRDHFDEYKALADRVYHPIKTMDSVYRYTAPIREILADVLGDAERMDQMRQRALSVRRYDSEEAAGGEIISAIDYVLDVYRSIGGIVNEIDRKHNAYTKRSVDTIRYHMTADQTISGKLTTILKACAASTGERREQVTDRMARGVRVNRQAFLDGGSLWRKNIKSRRVPAEPIAISADDLSPAETQELFAFLHTDRYSLQRIKGYMNRLFGDKTTLSAADIVLDDDAAFIMLLLAAIRAGERHLDFTVQMGTGGRDINGYRIPDMQFHKKGGAGHVE